MCKRLNQTVKDDARKIFVGACGRYGGEESYILDFGGET